MRLTASQQAAADAAQAERKRCVSVAARAFAKRRAIYKAKARARSDWLLKLEERGEADKTRFDDGLADIEAFERCAMAIEIMWHEFKQSMQAAREIMPKKGD